MLKDESLIAAFLLDGKGGGKSLSWSEIETWKPEDGILWVHLNFTMHKSVEWLKKNSGLDLVTAKAMTIDESRPRSLINPDGVLVFLRGVNLNPGQDPEDMVSIRIWVDQNRIITTRRRHLLSIDDIRNAIANNRGPKTTADFLIMLNDRLTDRMADVIETIDQQVDDLEQDVLTVQSHLLRPKIADIRRQSIAIRRYLAPQREALSRLYFEETPLLALSDRSQIREATERVVRYIEDLDSARDRAAITQEELTSRLSEQMDKRMYILSVVAVIFLPLTFITGLLGINVAGIPGSENKWAFLIVCTLLVATIGVMVWILYKKKWI